MSEKASAGGSLGMVERLGTVTQWQRNLQKPGEGFCLARSEGVTFHFQQKAAEGIEAVPAQGRELHVKGATILIEVSDPAEFAQVFHEFQLAGQEIGMRIHAEFKSAMPGMGKERRSS